jgi:uncharacterized protein YndB with AHSA1/START domain
MNPSHEVDSTLILKRIYDAPIALVWRAWTSSEELKKWYVAGWDHVVHFAEADVRVGGAYRIGFAPAGKTPYLETGRYTEVIAMQRLAFEETVSFEGAHIHTNQTIVDFRDLGGRTEVTITTGGFEAWRSAEGWVPALEKLAIYLAG